MREREPAILGAVPAAVPEGRSAGAESGATRPAVMVGGGRPARQARSAPRFFVVGFWRRLGAGLLDALILLPMVALMIWLAGAISGIELPPSRYRGPDIWLDLLLGVEPALWGAIGLAAAVAVVYAFVFQSIWGRTPGMRVARMRVIDLYGDPPTVARAGARTGGYLACVATLGLGFAWIGIDREKRGLHDWLSGTYVVKE